MKIRSFQPGDEEIQAALYNEVAAELPKFKPAGVEEVRRRVRARDFDPATRWYVEADGRVVGYATYQANGRVSFPWCLPGYTQHAEPLFQHVLDQMRQRGLKKAIAAYRADWPAQGEFFLAHGFTKVRDMVGFVLDLPEMPTAAAVPTARTLPFSPSDLPALQELGASILRLHDAAELERWFFRNPYFGPESLFVLRGRDSNQVVAIGLLISNPVYSNPKLVDANMPCYRLGAFGTENMTTKRINGLFSFLAHPDRDFGRLGIELMSYAALRLEEDTDAESLAAQVPSDAPHLLRFYQQHFRRQGSFPVFEREL